MSAARRAALQTVLLVLPLLFAGSACHRAAVWTAVTPDLTSQFTVQERDRRSCVRLGTREQGCFDGIDLHSVAFDSAGAHVAYAVRDGARWAIAVDGRLERRWDGVGAPRLSPDGLRLAYPADSGGRWLVVVDGRAGKAYDAIIAGSLRFDSAGRHVAYAAQRGADVRVVFDGRESAPWRAVGEIVLPPIAYTARDGGGWQVVVDGVASRAWEQARDLHLTSVGQVVYIARAQGRESMVMGERVVAWHDEVVLVALGTGDRVGYLARDGDLLKALLSDGRELARGALTDLALGAREYAAWVTTEGQRQTIVTPQGHFGFDLVVAGTLQFIGDGTSWAVLVGDRARRELRVVVDGRLTGMRLDWSEVTRRVQQQAGEAGLRSWVAAEARRALAATVRPVPSTPADPRRP